MYAVDGKLVQLLSNIFEGSAHMNQDINILIIEDEKKIADTLKFGLEENGYQVDVSYDGKLGLRMFNSHRYQLVIADINLPGMDGYELCRSIRMQNESVPIIMLTAMNTLPDKVEGYEAGADDYITKPFEFKELLLKMKVLLKRVYITSEPVNAVLKAAGLEMNVDSKMVTRDGKNIVLTAKEFQLLEYLLRNKNKVLSRADIAIHVWDIDFDTNTNVIDVYINYVRNKIDKDFEQKLIQTQVGMGYILKTN